MCTASTKSLAGGQGCAWEPERPQIPGLVSVVIPVFNRQDMVRRALDSVLAQTYRPIEIVAVDDGSTDRSKDTLQQYARSYPDLFHVSSQPNSGPWVARNHALQSANGEFVAFLDSDDVWVPTKLDLQIPLFRSRVGLVYSAIEETDANGMVIRTVNCDPGLRGDIYRKLLVKNRMICSSVVVRRAALERVGIYDESLRAGGNWELWLRISKHFEADFVDQPLAQYSKHGDNISLILDRILGGAADVLEKHLPTKPAPDDPLLGTYNEAYAHYYYRWGVALFSRGRYSESRTMFRRCWEYLPGYRDTRIRYLRSHLGKGLNTFLSRLKGLVSN